MATTIRKFMTSGSCAHLVAKGSFNKGQSVELFFGEDAPVSQFLQPKDLRELAAYLVKLADEISLDKEPKAKPEFDLHAKHKGGTDYFKVTLEGDGTLLPILKLELQGDEELCRCVDAEDLFKAGKALKSWGKKLRAIEASR